MSGRRSISNSFTVITVDDPVSVIAQYAPTDNPSSSQIHDTWQNGDLYMRTKSTEDGATWSSWQKIVGESGGETNYKFGISAQKTTASSTTAPTLKPNTTWSDAPVQVEANYPYLWSKVQKKDGNGNDVGVASYIRFTGEKGENAFVVDLENEMKNVALTEGGNTLTAVDFYFKVQAFYGTSNVLSDNECTVSASCSDSNVTLTTTAAKTTGIRVQVAQNVALANSTDITVTVTHTTYGTRTVVFTLAGVRGGENAILQELLPSLSDISFARQTDGSLTPASRSLTLSIKKTQGSSTSTQSISESGLTIRWSTSSMPAHSTDGNSWGSGTITGISWSSTTMQIANSVEATNIYIAAFKTSSGTLVDRETIPIIKDGKNGEDAPVAFATPDKISVPCNNNGKVKAEIVKSVTFSMKVGTHAASVTAVSNQSAPSGVTVNVVATNAITITISTIATSSGISSGVVLNVTGSYNSKSYTTQVTVALIGSDEGGKGENGTGGTFYEIVPSIENVRVPADTTETTLSSTPTTTFYKTVGTSRNTESLYWALYWKSGTQLTYYNSGGAASSINLPTTYSAGYDALVIFVYPSSSTSTSSFFAKKEIVILKNGNTGQNGQNGRDGTNGTNGTSAMYIHLKGTGQNNNQTALCESFNGTTLDSRSITSRGLTLIKILRSDLSISSITTYDVYGDTVSYGESACANLASALNIITLDYFVCLISCDAVRWTQELIDALGNFGSIGLNDTTAYRVPFAFIGYKGLPKGQAVQVQSGIGTTDAPAEITVYVKDGTIAVSKEPTVGRVGGRFYYNAGEYSYTSAVSFYVNDKEAPYFLYNNDYWVFEPNVSSTTYYSMADMGYPSSQNSNWHLMVYNKQQFFMSEVMFARYAHFGSFIFNGDWQLSTNGEIDGTTYNNSANIGGTVITSSGTGTFTIKGYTLFDQLYPLGDTIVVTSGTSEDTVVIGSQENTKTIATVYLRSDCVYKFKCKGRRYSDSYSVFVRLRSTSGSNGTWSPVYYPSTSYYESSTFTFRPQTSGYFYLEMYQPTLPSSSGVIAGGETNYWLLARVTFRPILAFDGMTGKTYQSDAYMRGVITSEDVLNGNKIVIDSPNGGMRMTGPVSVDEQTHRPNSDARENLIEMVFETDPDTMTRIGSFYVRDGRKKRETQVDPEYGVTCSNKSLSDERVAELSYWGMSTKEGSESTYREVSTDPSGFGLVVGAGSSQKQLLINEEGVSIRIGTTTHTKTWAQILGF